MNSENSLVAGAENPEVMAELDMSAHSFIIVTAPDPIRIRCLGGNVWITQDADRNDIVLAQGYQCVVQGAQRVYLSSLNGTRLAIANALPRAAGCAGVRSRSQTLRLDITQGAYTLSGGHTVSRDIERAAQRRQDEPSIVISSAYLE